MIWYFLLGIVLVLGFQLYSIYEEEKSVRKSVHMLGDLIFNTRDEFHDLYLVITVLCIVGWPFTLLYMIQVHLKK